MVGELAFDRFAPAANHCLQPFVERRFFGRLLPVADIVDEAEHGEIAALDRQAPVEQRGVGGIAEHVLDLLAHRGRHRVARQPDEGEEVPGKRGLHHRQLGPRPVGQAHHRGDDAFEVVGLEPDHQIVREGAQRMHQRLAGMAAGIEIELGDQLAEPRTQDGNLGRRGRQRGAGPDAGMDRQRGDLALLSDGNDEQVERDLAVDLAQPVRLDDQRALRARTVGSILEPLERAIVALVEQHRLAALAADAEDVAVRTVAIAGNVPELGEVAGVEPLQQRSTFGIPEPFGIGRHQFLHPGPVGDRGARVRQGRGDRLFELVAMLRIDPVGLDIDHRLAPTVFRGVLRHVLEPPLRIALHAQYGVNEAVDRGACIGEGQRNGIDQERHVVVDDRDPHEAFGCRTADRLDREGGFVRVALHRGARGEFRRLVQGLAGEFGLVGQ